MARTGGSYIKDKNGKTKLVECTQHHPKGDRPRSAAVPDTQAADPVDPKKLATKNKPRLNTQ